MKVVFDGNMSKEIPVHSSLPQGTVLGPLLSLCHINDFPSSVKSQVRRFTDDCLLYRKIHICNDYIVLQNDLIQLGKCAKRMNFNTSKYHIHTHISSIIRNANSTLGFLKCNISRCPPNTKRTSCIALVRTVLENEALVWDPYHWGGGT